MKVIDLLNKIANGETPPRKIKYCDNVFSYEFGDYEGYQYLTDYLGSDKE